jgi:hypothetical protein
MADHCKPARSALGSKGNGPTGNDPGLLAFDHEQRNVEDALGGAQLEALRYLSEGFELGDLGWTRWDPRAPAQDTREPVWLLLFGVPARGRHVRMEGASFTRLGLDGLVVEDFHFSDLAGLLGQLGVR